MWIYKDDTTYLDNTTKIGSAMPTNEVPNTHLTINNWHGLRPNNYGFGWSRVWDPSGPAKNQPSSSLFGTMHWRLMSGMLRLLPPNDVFASHNYETFKHEFWGCIQAKKAWNWACFIIMELSGDRVDEQFNLHWKHGLFGEGYCTH
jgi:hypothetical protein